MSSHAARFTRAFASFISLLAGTMMILLAREIKTFIEIDRQVNFDDLTPYVCFVIANYVVGGYGVLLCFLPPKSQLWKLAVAIDSLFLLFLVGQTSSCSSALSIGIMEKNGNTHACWLPICNSFPKYCNGLFVAIGLGYVGALVHVIMLMIKIQQGFNSILV